MTVPFSYVATEEELQRQASSWKQLTTLGVDLECENNLHHYGSYLSLIQLSDGDRHWIVDVLQLGHLGPLRDVFGNPRIQKIFHDVSFDLSILQKEFDCHLRNVFDTQLAALFLGEEHIGLGALLEKYFGVKKQQKFQMADWTKRPISREMLEYAVVDAVYLVKLRDLLKEKLRKQGRLEWVRQECRAIEEKNWSHTEPSFLTLRGVKSMTDQQRAVLKRLYVLREKLAKKVDRPVHFIMNTTRMMRLAKNPPSSVTEWQSMKGVHPIVKRQAGRFFQEVRKGLQERIPAPKQGKKRRSRHQRRLWEQVTTARDVLAEKLHLQRRFLVSPEQLENIVEQQSLEFLRPWQKELMVPLIQSKRKR